MLQDECIGIYTIPQREQNRFKTKKGALQVKKVHRKFGIWGLQGMENCDDDVFFCKHSKPLQQQKVWESWCKVVYFWLCMAAHGPTSILTDLD